MLPAISPQRLTSDIASAILLPIDQRTGRGQESRDADLPIALRGLREVAGHDARSDGRHALRRRLHLLDQREVDGLLRRVQAQPRFPQRAGPRGFRCVAQRAAGVLIWQRPKSSIATPARCCSSTRQPTSSGRAESPCAWRWRRLARQRRTWAARTWAARTWAERSSSALGRYW